MKPSKVPIKIPKFLACCLHFSTKGLECTSYNIKHVEIREHQHTGGHSHQHQQKDAAVSKDSS